MKSLASEMSYLSEFEVGGSLFQFVALHALIAFKKADFT